MVCRKCKGERIVWARDQYNRALAINCPVCNKNGVAVRKETAAWGDGHPKSILDRRRLAKIK